LPSQVQRDTESERSAAVDAERDRHHERFRPRPAALALAVIAVVGVAAGWWHFWFLTDDAFISFRYMSNAMLGRGLVWNPPPFSPVEGYTSWLWTVSLLQLWRATGIEPPVAANWISLIFGYATLFVVYCFVRRMAFPPTLARHRLAFLALVFLGTLTNRTFLTWLSSGLETSLFNFCFALWIYHALQPIGARRGQVFWISLAATLAALTRPDGLLLAAATPALFAIDALERPAPLSQLLRRFAWAFPGLGLLLHLGWRRSIYGEWLPNTYYAKYASPWPESGLRYAASFVLEYALWIWLGLALFWLVRHGRARGGTSARALVVAAAVGAHLAYYTFAIGGDHFEYRVYSHLVPLVFVSFAWLIARLELRPALAFSLFGVFILASAPLPWVHHLTTSISGRGLKTVTPVAPRFPPGLRWYARQFDQLQAWLIHRSVAVRQEEHAAFHRWLEEFLPPRAEGAAIDWDDRPVTAAGSVGVLGWRLPHVAIIDRLGLNDYQIARAPRPPRRGPRQMAHERRPPEGYVECFRPNVVIAPRDGEGEPKNQIVVEPRRRPLTDAEITRCEWDFRVAD